MRLDKRSRIILYSFGVAILAIIVIELTRPKPINWRDSYTAFDKIPFGSYIVSEELPGLFKSDKVTKINANPFEFLNDSTYKKNSSYLFINNQVPIDFQTYQKLQEYLHAGNTVFMSGKFFGGTFMDSLKIETETDYKLTQAPLHPVLFSNPDPDSFPEFKKKTYKTVFKSFDTLKTKALGYFKNEETALNQINFIKIQEGAGTLYLHTMPEAFSNFYALRNQEYAASCLSYAKNEHYYWDTYVKSGRKIVNSPLRFVLNQMPLKWAYYLLAIGLLLFVLFKGKREQRIIPVVKPLENTSIEFTKTIGDLYLQHQDYANIITKKITYFLEKIRSEYYLNTNNLDADFIEKLAHKSSNSMEETQKLVSLINKLRQNPVNNEEVLIKLNKAIEEFTA